MWWMTGAELNIINEEKNWTQMDAQCKNRVTYLSYLSGVFEDWYKYKEQHSSWLLYSEHWQNDVLDDADVTLAWVDRKLFGHL